MRVASLDEGVLVVPVEDLVAQIRDVNADLREAKLAGGVHTARLKLLYNDRGWRGLPALFKRIFRLLPVRALQIEDAVIVVWQIATYGEPRGDHVARALGQVVRPERLAELALRRSMLSNDGFERLQPFTAGLAHLDVSDNRLNETALKLLASWRETARTLKSLHFGRNLPSARGIAELSNGKNFPALARIDLSTCALGGASVRRLAEGSLPALTELTLAENPCGDEGAAALAESPAAERLERLDLSQCGIGEDGATALAGSPHVRSIGLLDLRGNGLGDRSRKRLHDRFGDRVLVG